MIPKPHYTTFTDCVTDMQAHPERLHIILTRHGRTHHNKEKRIQPWTPDGDWLIDEGKTAASQLGKTLSKLPLDAIYSSDWHRAFLTAQLINAEQTTPLTSIVCHSGLRDFNFGDWCGKIAADIRKTPAGQHMDTERHALVAPNGEIFIEFHKRIEQAFQDIRSQHTNGNILLVSHAYAALCSLLAALDIPVKHNANDNIKNTSITIIAYDNHTNKTSLLLYNALPSR